MATETDQPPAVRRESPSPDLAPAPAIGALPGLSRCMSATSDMSHGSGTDSALRDSLGSDAFSRHSSASFGRRSDISFASSRMSTISSADGRAARRRGYMRPQGTAFAASAQSRESVMSLGSIAHLQYYFARTGLLDGKGGQIQRKNKQNRETLDLSALDSTSLLPKMGGSDAEDSSYASMGSSPDLGTSTFSAGQMVESPTEEDKYDWDEFEEPDPDMPPPTTSTYIHREKPVPKPPTIEELKQDLTSSLEKAALSLKDAREGQAQVPGTPGTPTNRRSAPAASSSTPSSNPEQAAAQLTESSRTPRTPGGSHHARHQSKSQGWFEIQGMHILDVMTLAIRAAKMYYTAHEQPERLDTIRAERQIRADLFSVMETLKQMATRRWAGGMREEELANLESWIQGLFDMLRREDEMEAAERAERASWTWLGGDWTGREKERELAFLASLQATTTDTGASGEQTPLPEYSSAEDAAPDTLPTPFLKSMQNGLRLIRLHNAAVRKSKRRFGGVTTFHEDTEKPYRSADNLRYWVKAAELRWEVLLKIDALGIQYNSGPGLWLDFERAIFKWSRKVREEITAEQEA